MQVRAQNNAWHIENATYVMAVIIFLSVGHTGIAWFYLDKKRNKQNKCYNVKLVMLEGGEEKKNSEAGQLGLVLPLTLEFILANVILCFSSKKPHRVEYVYLFISF